MSSKESRTQSQAERTNHVIGSNESAASDEAHCNNSKPEEKLNNDKQTEVQSPEDADSSTYTDRENVADDSTSPSNQNQGTQILKRCPVELSEASNSEKSTNAQSMSTNGNISEFTQTGVEDTHEESTNAVSMSTNESTSESSQTGVEDEFSNVKHDASNQNEPAHSLERESALASIDTSNSDESTNGQSMSINENTSKLSPTGTEHTNRKNTDPATSKLNEFSIVEPRLKLKHEDGSLLSRCTDMKKETLATRIPLEILLLGDSGVGKTSLFKLMKLYADMNGLFSEETFKKRIQNISFIPLSTATTITYDAIYIENLAITVIDTPGFDEATSKDGKSWAENISHEVQRLKNLNCICLVINGTESRLTWHTSDVIKRLSSFLPKDLFQNVVVFFTHTSDDFSLTFADETLTTELGFPLKHTHVIDNPYARYCKANRRRRKIKSSLINDEFPEAFETLSQVLRTIKNFTKADDSHTDICVLCDIFADKMLSPKNVLSSTCCVHNAIWKRFQQASEATICYNRS